jgi:hypothetical protein
MPEEVVIVIVVLIGAIWLMVKLFQGLVSAIEGFEESAAKRRLERFAHAKSKLSAAVSCSLPNELDSAEKRIKMTEREFTEFQRASKRTAELY